MSAVFGQNEKALVAYNRGLALEEKDVNAAIADFTKAIEFDVNLAQAYARRGLILLEQKNKIEARRDLEKAIQLDVSLQGAYGEFLKLARKP